MKPWDDKRYWRGFQRQIARKHLLEHIKALVAHYKIDDTPANRIRRQEVESIAKAIRRRRRARRRN